MTHVTYSYLLTHDLLTDCLLGPEWVGQTRGWENKPFSSYKC